MIIQGANTLLFVHVHFLSIISHSPPIIIHQPPQSFYYSRHLSSLSLSPLSLYFFFYFILDIVVYNTVNKVESCILLYFLTIPNICPEWSFLILCHSCSFCLHYTLHKNSNVLGYYSSIISLYIYKWVWSFCVCSFLSDSHGSACYSPHV